MTSSLGRPLGFEKAEEILNKEESHDPLDFQTYFEMFESNLLNSIDKSSEETLNLANTDFEQVHQLCWSLYYNAYLTGSQESGHVPEALIRKLWTMFNLLAEDDDRGVPITPPRTDREELCLLLRAFITASGQHDAEMKILEMQDGEGTLTFKEFQKFFFNNFAPYFRFIVLSRTLDTVYEELVEDVLEKVWK